MSDSGNPYAGRRYLIGLWEDSGIGIGYRIFFLCFRKEDV